MRFCLDLMFSSPDEAVWSAMDGVSEEMAIEADGEDEQCLIEREFFMPENWKALKVVSNNQTSISLLYGVIVERNLSFRASKSCKSNPKRCDS